MPDLLHRHGGGQLPVPVRLGDIVRHALLLRLGVVQPRLGVVQRALVSYTKCCNLSVAFFFNNYYPASKILT